MSEDWPGRRLRGLRVGEGFSAAEVGRFMGVGAERIRQFERRNSVSRRVVRRYIGALSAALSANGYTPGPEFARSIPTASAGAGEETPCDPTAPSQPNRTHD